MSNKSNVIIADMKSFFKISGRPTRYIIEVEFELNNEKKKKKNTSTICFFYSFFYNLEEIYEILEKTGEH